MVDLFKLDQRSSHHLSRIRSLFAGLASTVRRGAVPLQLRITALRRHEQILSLWSSNTVCGVCLLRSPNHLLACRHAMCDACILDHFPSQPARFRTTVTNCLICARPLSQAIIQKPPSAKPSLLAIDGGGVRGIISLELLNRLERSLNVPFPLWEFFDLVVGTSAGQ